MIYLYIDIETIPVQCPKISDEIVFSATVPGNYKKPESIARWRDENRANLIEKTSFDGGYGQICALSWSLTNSGGHTYLNSHGDEGLINVFFEDVDKVIGSRRPVVVGHNVNGFDLPFIRKRCMIHGIPLPAWFPRDLKPWGGETFDTMLEWDDRKFVSLDRLAKIFGIEGKKGVDGSMVAQMWADGKHAEVAAYCADDVALTKKIHERMRVAL